MYVIQSSSHVWLSVTPWTTACQASLSLTISWSLPKFMSIELVMPSNRLILCRTFLLLPSIFPSIRGLSSSYVWLWELDHKQAEHRRTDAFKQWCWRRLLRVPWTARRSNQSILKEIPEYSLEGLMLKLKLQYFDHLMQRADSFEKTLMLGKIEGRRRRGPQRMRW